MIGTPASPNQTEQNTIQIDRLTRVRVIDPKHPLFGRSFPLLRAFSPRGNTTVTVLLPDGQRRVIPRTATDLDGETRPQTQSLPPISIRTILPLAQFVNAKIASEEKSDDSPKSTSRTRKGKKQDAQRSTAEPVETPGALSTEIARPTVGATHEPNATRKGSEQGGS